MDVTIKNPYTLAAYAGTKESILDIRAVDQDGVWYDIEMQVESHSLYGQRAVYCPTKTCSDLRLGTSTALQLLCSISCDTLTSSNGWPATEAARTRSMNLYPQHLRDRQHAEILHRRLRDRRHAEMIRHRAHGMDAWPIPLEYVIAPVPAPHLGRLGRLWSRGMGMTDHDAAIGLSAVATEITGGTWPGVVLSAIFGSGLTFFAVNLYLLPLNWAIVAGAIAALPCAWAFLVPLPRLGFRSLYYPSLSEREIDGLLVDARDDTARAYLMLVRDAIAQAVPDANLADIQAAIKALGNAVDHLPPIAVTPADASALRAEAASVLEQARQEPDCVISESLERRAEALNRRADANAQSDLVIRRAQALRAEVTSQMDALREGLAGFQGGISHEWAFVKLAEDALRVAAEATAVAQARAELDAPLAQMLARMPEDQAIRQANGR